MSRIADSREWNLPLAATSLFTGASRIEEPLMGLFVYLVMFIVACGFGWWAKGSGKSN
jgi:hypothetical protein